MSSRSRAISATSPGSRNTTRSTRSTSRLHHRPGRRSAPSCSGSRSKSIASRPCRNADGEDGELRIDELETPVPVIDLDRVDGNLRALQEYCDRHGLKLRPHIKTHKLPALAHQQVALGAVGITFQKLGESEVMADAGLDDILISYPLLGTIKAHRLAALAKR